MTKMWRPDPVHGTERRVADGEPEMGTWVDPDEADERAEWRATRKVLACVARLAVSDRVYVEAQAQYRQYSGPDIGAEYEALRSALTDAAASRDAAIYQLLERHREMP